MKYYIGRKRKFNYNYELENLIRNFPSSMKQKTIVDNGKIVTTDRTEEEIRGILERDYKAKKRKSTVYRFFKEQEYKMLNKSDIEYIIYTSDLDFSYEGKSFLEKYGNEKVTYKIKTINEDTGKLEEKVVTTTIQTALYKFKEGEISREDMNKILYEFKNKSTKYHTAGSS